MIMYCDTVRCKKCRWPVNRRVHVDPDGVPRWTCPICGAVWDGSDFYKTVSREEAAYIGDDLNDLGAMSLTAVTACPRDAVKEVQDSCTCVLNSRGGEGAVREFAELLLKKKGNLEECKEALWGQEARTE